MDPQANRTLSRAAVASNGSCPRPIVVGRKDAGMSLIEVVFASAILLFVAIGLLPLFVRSSFNNISGADSTRASQHAKSKQ